MFYMFNNKNSSLHTVKNQNIDKQIQKIAQQYRKDNKSKSKIGQNKNKYHTLTLRKTDSKEKYIRSNSNSVIPFDRKNTQNLTNQSLLLNPHTNKAFQSQNRKLIKRKPIDKYYSSAISTPKNQYLNTPNNQFEHKQFNNFFKSQSSKKLFPSDTTSKLEKKASSNYQKQNTSYHSYNNYLEFQNIQEEQNNQLQMKKQNSIFLTINQNIPTKDFSSKNIFNSNKKYSKLILSPAQNFIQKSHTITPEMKWEKIIELYTMRDQLTKKYQFTQMEQLKRCFPVLPGRDFYKIFLKNRLFQKQWHINFPQTFFLDTYSNIVMVYTDLKTGILKRKIIQKQSKQRDNYKDQILKFKQTFINDLETCNKTRLFKQIKIQQNPNIPLTIVKSTQNNLFQFQTDVHSYRNFIQRKKKPSRDSIVQRYVYSNDLKAMVFRLYYRRHIPGTQRRGPQFQGIKFQNQKSIFKQSGTSSFPQIHKLTTTISLSSTRIGSMKVSKITNPKALQKFILIGKQLQKMLQYTQKIIIDNLYIDFIVDIFQTPWIINIKYCQINPNCKIQKKLLKQKQKHINNVSSCRLCGAIQNKQNLKNSVSVRMLYEFITHLKKRTKEQENMNIDFINNININCRQNKTSYVCNVCYQVIIHELELIKIQKKLAQICNIIPQSDNQFIEANQKNDINNVKQFKQWRLMLFFQDIKKVFQNPSVNTNFNKNSGTSQYNKIKINNSSLEDPNIFQNNLVKNSAIIDPFNSDQQFILKYQICPKITQTFKCHKPNTIINKNQLDIKEMKLHYFYSQTLNIEQFINNTQIMLYLYVAEPSQQIMKKKQKSANLKQQEPVMKQQLSMNQKLVASGSTHVMSTFNLYKTSSFSLKSLIQNGQRQTATVLMFFKSKKYCQLTLKVGLVYDGSYAVSNIPAKGENNEQLSNFIKWNDVWFSKTLWNSNPMPKQWMQVFLSMPDVKVQNKKQKQLVLDNFKKS